MEYLQDLASLIILDVSQTSITDAGLRKLTRLTNLEDLRFGGTKVSDAGVDSLKDMKYLKTIEVWGTRMSDRGFIRLLEEHPSLEDLNFNSCKISDAALERLQSHQALKSLSLSGTQVTDAGLQYLKNLKQLQSLALHDTCISDQGLAHLKGLPLQELWLRGTVVTDAGIRGLLDLKLQALDLDGTQVSDIGLETLRQISTLKHLVLANSKVSAAGVVKLKAALPNCEVCLTPEMQKAVEELQRKGDTGSQAASGTQTSISTPAQAPKAAPEAAPTPAPAPALAPRTAEEIAARRQEFLDKYLKPLKEAKPEDVPEAKYADQFPPKQKFNLTLSTTGMTVKYFADFECKRLLDADRVKTGKTACFKAYFDQPDRLRQIESYGKDGGLSEEPSQGCATVRYWYNAQGLPVQEAFLDAAGNPSENNRLEIVVCHAYDADSKRVESRYFDGKGQPAEDRLGVHRRSYLTGKEPLEYRLDGTHRERWLPAVNLGKRINQNSAWCPCLTPDGKELYFATDLGPNRKNFIHRSVWQNDHWSDPQPLQAGGKPLVGLRLAISSDGSLMAFCAWKSDPFGAKVEYPDLPNYGGADIYVTERKDGQWQAVRNAGPKVNALSEEWGTAFVPGTHTLCFGAVDPKTGQPELWLADREADQWGTPRPLDLQPAANPKFSPDGNGLYFSAGRKGSFRKRRCMDGEEASQRLVATNQSWLSRREWRRRRFGAVPDAGRLWFSTTVDVARGPSTSPAGPTTRPPSATSRRSTHTPSRSRKVP